MNPALSVFLEIVKVTVPALIVFMTVYTLLKQYLEAQHKMRLVEGSQSQRKTTLPLRFTAYERLSLFCERISIPAMILRLKQKDMSANLLRISLMMAVQQEYEHNITQQVYVSDQLWQILKISKDDVINTIDLVSETVDPQADADVLVKALFHHLSAKEYIPLDKALQAIKKEASVLL